MPSGASEEWRNKIMDAKKILVPLDMSDFGESALPMAISVAKSLDASIELLTVFDDKPMVAGWPLDPAQARDACHAYLKHIGGLIHDLHGLEIEPTVIGGEVASAAVDYAQRSEPTFVVMSTHGRGPVSRSWFGSVADRMVTHISTPIMVVPAKEGGGEVGLETLPEFNKIVIPLDGSRRAERSLEWAYRLSSGPEAQYALVRGVPEPNFPASIYLPDSATLREKALEKGATEAQIYIDTLAAFLRETDRNVCTEVFAGGHVATNIHRFAEKTDADLLVIASHGRSGVSRMLLGSMADKLVRMSEHPVLVVRSV
jgi:nucleotide-binding universal stress UspA family protein